MGSFQNAFIIEKIGELWTYQIIYSNSYNWGMVIWMVFSLVTMMSLMFQAYLKVSLKRKKKWMWAMLSAIIVIPIGMSMLFLAPPIFHPGKYFILSPFLALIVFVWVMVFSNFKLFKASPHDVLHDILKGIPSIIVLVDLKMRITYINAEGLTTFKLSKKALIRKQLFRVLKIFELDFFDETSMRRIGQGELLNREISYNDKLFYNVKLTPIFNKKKVKTGFLIVANDYTNSKIEERKRNQINELLKKSNKELERFAYIASHDLKTPLRNIISFVGLTEKAVSKKDFNSIPEFMGYLKMYSKNMLQIVEDVLELSKVKKETAKLESVNIGKLLTMVKFNLRKTIMDKNAKIEYASFPEIYANKSQILQVFQNLIENGMKYNNSAMPFIYISHHTSDRDHHFSVRDNGIGIGEEYYNEVFEMFRRLHTLNEYEGTGIGLALCKKIIEAHGGEINIKSSNGGGTEVVFQIPIKVFRKNKAVTKTKFKKFQWNLS